MALPAERGGAQGRAGAVRNPVGGRVASLRADALAGLSLKTEGAHRAQAVRELMALAESEEGAGTAVKALARTGAWDIEGMSDLLVSRLTVDTELLRFIAGAVPERFWNVAWAAAQRVALRRTEHIRAQLAACAPEGERSPREPGGASGRA